MKLLNKKEQFFSTKSWWIFIFVFVLIFIPYLIIWLLLGEMNLLKNDWLIAKNSIIWHGYVTTKNFNWLLDNFSKYCSYDLNAELTQFLNVDKQGSIISSYVFFNWNIVIIVSSLILWSFIFVFIFYKIKLNFLDVLPFSLSCSFGCSVFIITGILQHFSTTFVYFLVRLIITLLILSIVFFITNFFLNLFLVKTKHALDIALEYKFSCTDKYSAKGDFKNNINDLQKEKDKDQTFIDIQK